LFISWFSPVRFILPIAALRIRRVVNRPVIYANAKNQAKTVRLSSCHSHSAMQTLRPNKSIMRNYDNQAYA